MKQYFVLGTYTEDILFGTGEVFHGKGEGVLICSFEEGKIAVINRLSIRNPSFLCVNSALRKIYAVNELKEYMGIEGGGITQIGYDCRGQMKVEKTVSSMGKDPCHIAVAPNGKLLAAANFADGSVILYPLNGKGEINGEGSLFHHYGRSTHPIRQTGPHAHSILFSERRGLMYVPDLGLDRVEAYTIGDGQAMPCAKSTLVVPDGSGPRYGEFDRKEENLYLVNEISSKVQRFQWTGECMEARESVSTLPEDFQGDNICSDLHLSPNGKWLYASNRGHDSLACFALEDGGKLCFQGCVSCGGKTPRNFAMDASGKFLLVGNQDSDSIVVFAVEDTGKLKKVNQVSIGSPVCIRFFSGDLE